MTPLINALSNPKQYLKEKDKKFNLNIIDDIIKEWDANPNDSSLPLKMAKILLAFYDGTYQVFVESGKFTSQKNFERLNDFVIENNTVSMLFDIYRAYNSDAISSTSLEIYFFLQINKIEKKLEEKIEGKEIISLLPNIYFNKNTYNYYWFMLSCFQKNKLFIPVENGIAWYSKIYSDFKSDCKVYGQVPIMTVNKDQSISKKIFGFSDVKNKILKEIEEFLVEKLRNELPNNELLNNELADKSKNYFNIIKFFIAILAQFENGKNINEEINLKIMNIVWRRQGHFGRAMSGLVKHLMTDLNNHDDKKINITIQKLKELQKLIDITPIKKSENLLLYFKNNLTLLVDYFEYMLAYHLYSQNKKITENEEKLESFQFAKMSANIADSSILVNIRDLKSPLKDLIYYQYLNNKHEGQSKPSDAKTSNANDIGNKNIIGKKIIEYCLFMFFHSVRDGFWEKLAIQQLQSFNCGGDLMAERDFLIELINGEGNRTKFDDLGKLITFQNNLLTVFKVFEQRKNEYSSSTKLKLLIFLNCYNQSIDENLKNKLFIKHRSEIEKKLKELYSSSFLEELWPQNGIPNFINDHASAQFVNIDLFIYTPVLDKLIKADQLAIISPKKKQVEILDEQFKLLIAELAAWQHAELQHKSQNVPVNAALLLEKIFDKSYQQKEAQEESLKSLIAFVIQHCEVDSLLMILQHCNVRMFPQKFTNMDDKIEILIREVYVNGLKKIRDSILEKVTSVQAVEILKLIELDDKDFEDKIFYDFILDLTKKIQVPFAADLILTIINQIYKNIGFARVDSFFKIEGIGSIGGTSTKKVSKEAATKFRDTLISHLIEILIKNLEGLLANDTYIFESMNFFGEILLFISKQDIAPPIISAISQFIFDNSMHFGMALRKYEENIFIKDREFREVDNDIFKVSQMIDKLQSVTESQNACLQYHAKFLQRYCDDLRFKFYYYTFSSRFKNQIVLNRWTVASNCYNTAQSIYNRQLNNSSSKTQSPIINNSINFHTADADFGVWNNRYEGVFSSYVEVYLSSVQNSNMAVTSLQRIESLKEDENIEFEIRTICLVLSDKNAEKFDLSNLATLITAQNNSLSIIKDMPDLGKIKFLSHLIEFNNSLKKNNEQASIKYDVGPLGKHNGKLEEDLIELYNKNELNSEFKLTAKIEKKESNPINNPVNANNETLVNQIQTEIKSINESSSKGNNEEEPKNSPTSFSEQQSLKMESSQPIEERNQTIDNFKKNDEFSFTGNYLGLSSINLSSVYENSEKVLDLLNFKNQTVEQSNSDFTNSNQVKKQDLDGSNVINSERINSSPIPSQSTENEFNELKEESSSKNSQESFEQMIVPEVTNTVYPILPNLQENQSRGRDTNDILFKLTQGFVNLTSGAIKNGQDMSNLSQGFLNITQIILNEQNNQQSQQKSFKLIVYQTDTVPSVSSSNPSSTSSNMPQTSGLGKSGSWSAFWKSLFESEMTSTDEEDSKDNDEISKESKATSNLGRNPPDFQI